jgi:hypothetical protein
VRRRPLLACAAALPLLAGGCFIFAPPQPSPTPEEGTWAKVRARFTARAKLYDGLTTRAFASAVYQARELREARVLRLGIWRGLTAEERERLLAMERDEAAQFDDFLVALFTADRPDNDLDATRSIWRVSLAVAGEGEAEPVKIDLVKPDATMRELYPNIGDFDTVYRVRFAKWAAGPLDARAFTLTLSSARGKLVLDFPSKGEG